jgi:pimeloyl-ACP methyl ester carboxylesterase
MGRRIAALSGWGQPYDALAAIAPQATHIQYAHHKTINDALADIASQAHNHDVVVGWSLGGQLAVRAMAANLFLPKKLVLIAAPFQFVSTEKNPLGMKRELYNKFRENVARNPERALHKAWELILKGDRNPDEVREWLNRQDKAKVLENDWLQWLDMLDGFSFDGMDLSGFPPTLLIHGDGDAVVGHEQSQKFSAAILYAKLMIIEGAGHAPHWHDVKGMQEAIEEHVR